MKYGEIERGRETRNKKVDNTLMSRHCISIEKQCCSIELQWNCNNFNRLHGRSMQPSYYKVLFVFISKYH